MANTPVTAHDVTVYNATPKVRVDSQDNATVNSQLVAMEMRESEGGLASAEVRFLNFGTFGDGGPNLVFEDGSVLKLGAKIELLAGDQSSPVKIFEGKISALEGRYHRGAPPELLVLAEDPLQAARLKRRTRLHEHATVADLIKSVASDLGLTAAVDQLDSNIGTQLQLNETDLGFLRRLLARYDGDMIVSGTQLQAAPRDSIQRYQVEMDYDSGKLRDARVLADLAHQATKVTYSGWDYSQGEVAAGERTGNPPAPGSGKSGQQSLQESFGERAEQLSNFVARDAVEAQALADADYEQRSRRFVTLRGTTEGNPQVRVGTHLKAGGMGPRFSNTYYVTSAIHRFDLERGYETEFVGECAFLGSQG